MTEEMLTECLIDQVDYLDEIALESQIDVILGLSNAYVKAAEMQAVLGDDFPAEAMIFENAAAAVAPGPNEARVGTLGDQFRNSKIYKILSAIFEAIGNALAWIVRKVKRFFHALSPKHIKNVVHCRNSQLKQVLVDAGYNVRVDEDDSWSVMVESIDFPRFETAVQKINEQLLLIEHALDAIANNNHDLAKNYCKKIRRPTNENVLAKELKRRVWMKYDECANKMQSVDKTLDPLIKRSRQIHKLVVSVSEQKIAEDDKNYQKTLNTIHGISNRILADISEANGLYSQLLAEQMQDQVGIQYAIEQIISDTAHENWVKGNPTAGSKESKAWSVLNNPNASWAAKKMASKRYAKFYNDATKRQKEFVDDVSRLRTQTPGLDPDRKLRDEARAVIKADEEQLATYQNMLEKTPDISDDKSVPFNVRQEQKKQRDKLTENIGHINAHMRQHQAMVDSRRFGDFEEDGDKK